MNKIFIVSQPRSGSTLLQNIIEQDSQVTSSGEFWMCLPLFHQRPLGGVEIRKSLPYNSRSVREAVKSALSEMRISQNSMYKAAASFYDSIVFDYLQSRNVEIYLDKTPRYYYIIDELRSFFPDDKLVILKRDHLNVLNSMLRTWVKGNILLMPYFRDDLLLFPEIISNLDDHVAKGCYIVQYENIIKNPELEMEGLYEYLGIAFNNELLHSFSSKSNRRFGDPLHGDRNTIEKKDYEKYSLVNKILLTGYYSWLKENGYVGSLDREYIFKNVTKVRFSRSIFLLLLSLPLWPGRLIRHISQTLKKV